MKDLKFTLLSIFMLLSIITLSQNTINVYNKTGQRINQIGYWIGSETEAQGASLIFKSRGSLDDTAAAGRAFNYKISTIIK